MTGGSGSTPGMAVEELAVVLWPLIVSIVALFIGHGWEGRHRGGALYFVLPDVIWA
ncbi:hypothetical protein [Corynebacterium glyciniphilum]|uniref:hypothetical protein n=1 Tax=Corynebacterium glyciniphilum TaxID=1404244 RepID=UPI003DA17F43